MPLWLCVLLCMPFANRLLAGHCAPSHLSADVVGRAVAQTGGGSKDHSPTRLTAASSSAPTAASLESSSAARRHAADNLCRSGSASCHRNLVS